MQSNSGTFDPENFEPVTIGPSWQTDEDGEWYLPEHTLGWQIAAWCAEWLTNDEGKPWMFTPEQLRFLLWLYAVNERGRTVYSSAVLQRLKGWGKDPFAAAVCLVELIGPCRFSHWNANGEPIGKPNRTAWVQLAAVNYVQNVNTFLLFPAMLPAKTIKQYGMEVGKEKIRAVNDTCLLEAVTSAYRSQEGKRPSFVIRNETHHWNASNGGHEMADVLARNAQKSKMGASRWLDLTNAYMPGEDSVAERQRDAYLDTLPGPNGEAPLAPFSGVLYDSLEAPSNATLTPEAIPLVLAVVRGDSVWLDIETITQAMQKRNAQPSQMRRFWYNQIVADEETMVSTWEWKEILTPSTLRDGEEICLGFDGSKTEDATALVAIRLADRCVFPIKIWEEDRSKRVGTEERWQVDRADVDNIVDNTFERFKVRAFFADLRMWESYIDLWSDRFRDKLLVKATTGQGASAVGFDMSGHQEEITHSNQRLVSAVLDKGIHHSGDPHLTKHVMNTKKRYNRFGMTFGKDTRDPAKKNDGYAAMLLAFMAMNKYLESGKRPQKERSGEFWMQ